MFRTVSSRTVSSRTVSSRTVSRRTVSRRTVSRRTVAQYRNLHFLVIPVCLCQLFRKITSEFFNWNFGNI